MTSFSISVPVGAWHPLLPTCFASLACQTGEIRVSLLDASGDSRVRDAADQYGGLFAFRRHGPDEGQSAAIVEGWERVEGDILGWLNVDDFLYPGAIEKARTQFEENPSAGAVFGHSAVCDQNGRMTGYHWGVDPSAKALRLGCSISQPSCFFRRSIYESVGGLNTSLHYTMDWDLWLRLLDDGARFAFIDTPLSVVYWGKGTKTLGMTKERRRELARLIEKYTPRRQQFRVRRGYFLRSLLDGINHAPTKRTIESLLRRYRPCVFGVGPNGALAEKATIIWPRFNDLNGHVLTVLAHHAEGLDVSAAGVRSIDRRGNEIDMTFDDSDPATAVVTVSLEKRDGSRSRLISCGWR